MRGELFWLAAAGHGGGIARRAMPPAPEEFRRSLVAEVKGISTTKDAKIAKNSEFTRGNRLVSYLNIPSRSSRSSRSSRPLWFYLFSRINMLD
jgi:hypothetical protein